MGDRSSDTHRLDGPRLAVVALVAIIGTFGVGLGLVRAVDALEPDDGCDSYGGGGYGCDSDGTITVTPSTGLVDRQVVTVDGTRFAQNTSFGIVQCDPTAGPDAGIDSCDLSTVRLTSTDGGGNVRYAFPVRRIIVVQGREIDCALSPCNIGAATVSGTTPIEAATAPISFDPAVPPVPRLAIDITVDEVTAAGVTGHITCNRDAETYLDASVQQVKGKHTAFAYGYSDGAITCTTVPTSWTIPFFDSTAVLLGGKATYDVYGYAYDGFEVVDTVVSGTATLRGGGVKITEPSSSPGETVSIEVVGATKGPEGLAVDLLVQCDRATSDGYVYATIIQRAGLESVQAFGRAEIGPCDGATPVSVPVTELTGVLAGGPAEVRAQIEVLDIDDNGFFFDYASVVDLVRLRGVVRTEPIAIEPDPSSRIAITGASRTQLSGTVTCEEPATVSLYTDIQQQKGRTVEYGFGFGEIACDGLTSFDIPLEGSLGGGQAVASVYADAYRVVGEPSLVEYEYLWSDQQGASVRLRG